MCSSVSSRSTSTDTSCAAVLLVATNPGQGLKIARTRTKCPFTLQRTTCPTDKPTGEESEPLEVCVALVELVRTII
eukprot:4994610-Pleurochrysis_carterae.AAC.1